jgi:PAS domain S-box-containing protein
MSEVSKDKSSGIKSQFEALFEYATIGMLITNGRGEIGNFNACAEAMFGYTRQELTGKPIEILIPDAVRSRHENLRNGFFKKPENRPMGSNRDLYAKKKDGTVFPVEVSLAHFTHDQEANVIAFIIDITVRKAGEDALIRQQQELEQVSDQIRKLNSQLEQKVEDRTKMMKEALSELEQSRQELSQLLQKEKELGDLKSKFVTMASHEFRTPLSTIHSSAALIRKYSNPEDEAKREKHLKRIQDSVENMRDILEDFLSIGRIEEGKIKLNPELITAEELKEEINRMVIEMQHLAKTGQKILFTHQVKSDYALDLKMLRHVLINLLSNAIKFSPENEEVKITCTEEADNLVISVSDRGIGISQQDQKRLFERFFRGENAANIQGTGLGLYLVSRYMEMAKGRINWSSEPGNGTTFNLYLPKQNS